MQKENISKLVSANKGCFGCGACRNICPVNAIDMGYDDDGYLIPVVNNEKCVACGRCHQVCPLTNNNRVVTHFQYDDCVAFAAWAPLEIRMKCSSGGVAPIFSNSVMENGGMVFGAIWNDDFTCSIMGTSVLAEAKEQRYSKYLQSNTELTFREVKKQIEIGNQVLYFGMPCQIAGLNRFLGELCDHESLITVDILCSHAPSSQFFQRYISENFSDLKKVTFRSKRDMGWSCDGHVMEMSDGERILCTQSTDSYQAAYHGFIMRRQLCEECPFAEFPRQGDITIGDFWGIGYEDASWDDGNGTSLIIANSHKGLTFVKKIIEKFDRIEEVPIRWARNKGNRIGDDSRKGHKNAKYFTRLLKKHSFNQSVYDALQDKHDIGLVCYSNRNYGNNLTNYALYRYLNDCGYSVLMINTPKDSFFNQDIYFGDGFIENPYYEEDLAERLCGAEYVKYNNRCDFFCVGSDQLFRENFVEGMEFSSILKFVYSYKFKFSYGTSFGNAKYDNCDQLKNKVSYLLSRFQAVSVREQSGVDIIRDKFDIEKPMHVVDPVFLVDSKVFHNMADIGKKHRIGTDKYIGAYFLDPNDAKERILKKVVAESKLEDKVILDRETYAYKDYVGEMHVLDDPKVEEWLALIRESQLFLTDSFHGVCFALIFHKDFYVLFDKNNWRGIERISEILDQLGLSDRLIILDDNARFTYSTIDYSKVNEILEKNISKSKSWLNTSLETARNFKGMSDSYDVFLDDYSDNKKRNIELKDQLQRIKADLYLLKNHRNYIQGGTVPTMNRTIIAFGIGDCLKRNIETVSKTCKISYLADNNPEKWGKKYYGIECIPPSQIAGFGDAFVLIFIDDVGAAFSVVRQLNSMGVYSIDHISNYRAEVINDV